MLEMKAEKVNTVVHNNNELIHCLVYENERPLIVADLQTSHLVI